MSKFTKSSTAVLSPVRSTTRTRTHEGGEGFARDAKSELFLLAATNMVGEETFYETAGSRDDRFTKLIAEVAREDPGWIASFIPYLRNEMNLRSAPVVMAAELVRARLGNSDGLSLRSVVDSALVRADEPAEFLGYWLSRYGRRLPMPVKRGLADAAKRVYTERSALKYDSREASVRMGDVIELAHPAPETDYQRALFRYLIDRRHNRDKLLLDALPMILAREAFSTMSKENQRPLLLNSEWLRAAGATWEWASSQYGKLDAAFWEAMIPQMGYMALLRNLRNFDDAGVSDEVKAKVATKLGDPEAVAKSRQLPMRFYSAYREARGFHWAQPLESALNTSLASVPEFPGRTLVLIDVSGSMFSSFSQRGTASRHEVAGIFGGAVALRSEKATLVQYGTDSQTVPYRKGDPLLRIVDLLENMGGTNTWQAVNRHYDGHDRIVIVTDEQAHPTYGASTRPDTLTFTFNVAGYRAGHSASGSGNHHTVGGLTDAGFKMIRMIEQAGTGDWPF